MLQRNKVLAYLCLAPTHPPTSKYSPVYTYIHNIPDPLCCACVILKLKIEFKHRVLQLRLYGKQQHQREDMRRYVAVRHVGAYGEPLPAGTLSGLRVALRSGALGGTPLGLLPAYVAAALANAHSRAGLGPWEGARPCCRARTMKMAMMTTAVHHQQRHQQRHASSSTCDGCAAPHFSSGERDSSSSRRVGGNVTSSGGSVSINTATAHDDEQWQQREQDQRIVSELLAARIPIDRLLMQALQRCGGL